MLQVDTAARVASATWKVTFAPASPPSSGVVVKVVELHPERTSAPSVPGGAGQAKNGIMKRALSPIPISTFSLNTKVIDDGAVVTGFPTTSELNSILGGKRGEDEMAVATMLSEDANVTA